MRRIGFLDLFLVSTLGCGPAVRWVKAHPMFKHKPTARAAQVTILSGAAGCRVDQDGVPMGKTGASGNLVLRSVSLGDHYFHVDCPGQTEVTGFLSLRAGEKSVMAVAALRAQSIASMTPLQAAAARMRLRHMVERAIESRSQGQFDQAVSLLRQATQLDPNNPDLHRELGITFLLNHDWAEARIELIEALRHEPNSADAHNDLGYSLEKLGRLRAALAQYRVAHRLDPANATYRKHYFDLLAQLPEQPQKRMKK